MVALHREKVQSYRIEVAKDAHRAEELRLEFETSIYTHAMVCNCPDKTVKPKVYFSFSHVH